MAQGGKRQGAGRPKGSTNVRSRDLVAKAAASGLLPHEFLLAVVRGERIALLGEGPDVFHTPTFAERLEAARIAAPYYAPRLAATTLTGPGGGPVEFVSQEQRDAAVRASYRADHLWRPAAHGRELVALRARGTSGRWPPRRRRVRSPQ